MTTGKSLKTQGFRDALQFLLSTAVNCQSAIYDKYVLFDIYKKSHETQVLFITILKKCYIFII